MCVVCVCTHIKHSVFTYKYIHLKNLLSDRLWKTPGKEYMEM